MSRPGTRVPLAALLVVAALLEGATLLWLGRLERGERLALIQAEDTSVYVDATRALIETRRWPATTRTLGYPLFLVPGYLAGGEEDGAILSVALQFLLNLGFTALAWRMLERLAPDTSTGLRVVLTAAFFWASFGLASYLLSDFLAALFFGVFLYGFLFLRSPRALFGTGLALAAATLTRPTFLLVPLLLPVLALLVDRATLPIGWKEVGLLAGFSLAATALSIAHQVSIDGYRGPSPVLTQNLQHTLYAALDDTSRSPAAARGEFEAEIGRRAGRPFTDLTRGEQERQMTRIFKEQLAAHPAAILKSMARTSIQYVFAPVESVPMRRARQAGDEAAYMTGLRPILTLVCLPFWLLAIVPPAIRPGRRPFYLLAMLLLLYVVGITAITPMQGERIRLPVLILLLPIMAWNVQGLVPRLARLVPRARPSPG
ncbi:MAG TPA: hypothetical protein VJV75_05230 [Candidatus Polarisedimenticolia bacterium]|nr:hypothetical protein [Candidatus Polarisedimenticolia bacterium]